jgi:hypothetical protein
LAAPPPPRSIGQISMRPEPTARPINNALFVMNSTPHLLNIERKPLKTKKSTARHYRRIQAKSIEFRRRFAVLTLPGI